MKLIAKENVEEIGTKVAHKIGACVGEFTVWQNQRSKRKW
jgi:hypothetical protein